MKTISQHSIWDYAAIWIIAMNLILVILKLTGYTDIHWLWVFAPIWVPVVFVMIVATLYYVLLFVVAVFLGFLDGMRKFKNNQ
jgi:hypothetical protein